MIYYSPQVSLGNIYCLLKYVINVCYILDQLDVYILTIYFNVCNILVQLDVYVLTIYFNVLLHIGPARCSRFTVNCWWNVFLKYRKKSRLKNQDTERTWTSNPLLESIVIPALCDWIWFDILDQLDVYVLKIYFNVCYILDQLDVYVLTIYFNVCYILDQLDVYVLTIYFNVCSVFSNLKYCSFINHRTHKIKEKLDNPPYVRILK